MGRPPIPLLLLLAAGAVAAVVGRDAGEVLVLRRLARSYDRGPRGG